MSNAPGVGVAVLIERNGLLLMLRRSGVELGEGAWGVPGGHLDFGETPEQCAVREAYEETGVTVDGIRFVGITNDVFQADGLHYITIWMQARFQSGEPAVTAPEESDRVGWFAWDALPGPLFLRCKPARWLSCPPGLTAPPDGLKQS
jgi:8-oxo-dGTP diphosphatase